MEPKKGYKKEDKLNYSKVSIHGNVDIERQQLGNKEKDVISISGIKFLRMNDVD